MSARSKHRDAAMAFARERGAEGITSAEFMVHAGVTFKCARQILFRAANCGELHRIPGKTYSRRLFASPELASAYLELPKAKRVRPCIKPQSERTAEVAKRVEIAGQMANKPGGVTRAELIAALSISGASSKNLILRAVSSGVLHRIPGVEKSLRYFATAEQAKAYGTRKKAKAQHVLAKAKQPALTVSKAASKPADEAFKAAQPRITSETRVTVAQTPPPRFYVSAAPRITNPAECRPWAVAAAESRGQA